MEQLSQAMFMVGPFSCRCARSGRPPAGPTRPRAGLGGRRRARLANAVARASTASTSPSRRRRSWPAPVSQTSVGRRSAGPPVRRVALTLDHAFGLQPVDDLADHRLDAAEVPRGLPDGQRALHGEVREHGPRRCGQVAARAVAPAVGEVQRAEQRGEALRLLPHPVPPPASRHGVTVPSLRSVVNPDGSPIDPDGHPLGCPATPRSYRTAFTSVPPASCTLRR